MKLFPQWTPGHTHNFGVNMTLIAGSQMLAVAVNVGLQAAGMSGSFQFHQMLFAFFLAENGLINIAMWAFNYKGKTHITLQVLKAHGVFVFICFTVWAVQNYGWEWGDWAVYYNVASVIAMALGAMESTFWIGFYPLEFTAIDIRILLYICFIAIMGFALYQHRLFESIHESQSAPK